MIAIVDANNLFAMAYFAGSLEPEYPAFGAGGFLATIASLISRYEPNHMVLAWDSPRLDRKKEWSGYKVGRPPKPPDYGDQLALARRAADQIGMFSLESSGMEADDIIYTLTVKLISPVVVVTSDRDMLQLVRDGVTLDLIKKYKTTDPATGSQYFAKTFVRLNTPEDVKELYGVYPWQIPDFKGLAGDSSDNLPHPEGIGEKRAIRLLERFGDLDGVIENAHLLTQKNGKPYAYAKALQDGLQIEWAHLSKCLAEPRLAPVLMDFRQAATPDIRKALDKIEEVKTWQI